MSEQTPEKSAFQQALEKQFDALLGEINKKFNAAGDQVLGLSKWMQVQLQMVQNKVRKAEISQSIIDVSTTSLLELMMEKGLITQEEVEKKTQEVIARKSADAPKSDKK